MRIGIISDFHFGHKNARQEVLESVLKDLQDSVDIIVDCGDLIDTNTINAVQAQELFNIFSGVKIPYHLVRGNHDTLSNSTVASLLAMNKNIIVHNSVSYDKDLNMIFVPYTNNKKELIDKLENLQLENCADFAFSHITLTDNIYSTFLSSDIKKLSMYAPIWFNGHIHTPEVNYGPFGSGIVYNVGSLSNLTFGDKHIPAYCIYDTSSKTLAYVTALGSIIHTTIKLEPYDGISSIFSKCTVFSEKHKQHFINWQIVLPNDTTYVKDRVKIKNFILQQLPNTMNVTFSYSHMTIEPTVDADSTNGILSEAVKHNKAKMSKDKLIKQLIEQYEKDNEEKLTEQVKNLVLEGIQDDHI